MSEASANPLPGLPEPLPEGERVLWRGSPRFIPLAWRAFHVREVAIYFGVLAIWRAFSMTSAGRDIETTAMSVSWLLFLGLIAAGILGLLAWITTRTTIYTITNRRVVMRYGIALPMTINLPFRAMGAAGVRIYGGGVGDIPLAMDEGKRLAYLVLWPHVRPWHLSKPQPMLRAVADAAGVAEILGRAAETTVVSSGEPAPSVARDGDRTISPPEQRAAAA